MVVRKGALGMQHRIIASLFVQEVSPLFTTEGVSDIGSWFVTPLRVETPSYKIPDNPLKTLIANR
jgi:hypothetical protein